MAMCCKRRSPIEGGIQHHEHQSWYLDAFAAIPSIEDVPPYKNRESLFYDASEDDKRMRYIQLLRCPCHGECDGSNSFKHANVWSFFGHLSMFSYLMHHLMYSEKHNKEEEEAFNIIIDALADGELETNCVEYTANQRRIYRNAHGPQKRARMQFP